MRSLPLPKPLASSSTASARGDSGIRWGRPVLVRSPEIVHVPPSISSQVAFPASPERQPVRTTNSTASFTTGDAVLDWMAATAAGTSSGASAR